MRALVTGAAGFVGQWLCKALLADGYAVTGVALEQHPVQRSLTPAESQAIRWQVADLRDGGVWAGLLDDTMPDVVFHLAGIAFVPTAGGDPAGAWMANTLPAVGLCAALAPRVAAGVLDPVLLVVGSAEQYGAHPATAQPLREDAALAPRTVYAATKVAQEVAVLQAHRAHGIRAIVTRSFNHSGPGQSTDFLLPALVRRALDLRASGARELPLGNLTPIRDFSHVADVVAAYVALAQRGVPGAVYNVASGVGTSVAALVQMVLDRTGVSATLVPDPALQRTVDVPMLVGDASKLRADTGWVPTRDVPAILDDLIHAQAD
jgi:GDP-4-dehydro-6-deoxy-D-mannose reductase